MLYACAARFNVMKNLEKFFEFWMELNKASDNKSEKLILFDIFLFKLKKVWVIRKRDVHLFVDGGSMHLEIDKKNVK